MALYIDEDGELRDNGESETPVTEVVIPGGSATFDESNPTLSDAEVEAELERFREEYKDEIPNMEGFEKEIGAANVKTVTDFLSKYGKKALDLFKDKEGKLDWTKLLAMAGGAYATTRPSGSTPTGYQGKIPKLTATSNMLTAPPVGRRPGSGGINYGGGTTYRDEKGNVVSSNEKTLEELLAAAASNPYNRPSTYENPSYGRPPVSPTPGGGGLPDIAPTPTPTPSPAPAPAPAAPTPTPTPGGGGLPDIAPSPNGGASQAPASSPIFTVGGDGTGYVPPKVPLNSMGLPITPSPGEPGSPEAKAAAFEKQQAELQARMASRAAAAASGAPKDEFALSGGVYANFAAGGLAPKGFVVPADVVSHLGNGSSEAGLKLLASKFGADAIKGEGDGMSDSIPTTIGGKQEARVANDEAFISPEMVKKIGGGSAEKGAKKLYAMMDRVREERTGTTEQGKQIDPNKFMPGGSVKKYQVGGTTTKTTPAGATGSESSLSNWAGDYVTNMLGQGQAEANKEYKAYTGPLTAGASGLQNQAFGMASNLRTPGSIGQAAGTAGGIANLAANMRYTPQTTNFLGQPNVSGLGMSPSYGMPQQGGSVYNPATGATSRDMVPLMSGDPRTQGPGQFLNPGSPRPGPDADGGMISEDSWMMPGESPDRFAVDGEMTGGVMRQPKPDYSTMPVPEGGLMARGGNQQQMDQDRDAFAQRRQQLSQDTLSKIPAHQQLQALQSQLQGGRPSPEQEQQLKMLNMQIQDDPSFKQMQQQQQQMQQQFEQQYSGDMSPPGQSAGLPGLMQGQPQQPQASQPVGNIAQQYMNPYLESALRPQMAEMQRVADIARMSDASRLTQAGAYGGSRQAIMESEGRRNLLGKQSEALGQGYATAYDKAMAQFNSDQTRRAQEAQFGATFGLDSLKTGIQGAQAQAQAGALQSTAEQAGLRGLLDAGAVERGIESEGVAADKAQFEEARLNPFKMVQFQQSLLSGMPLSAQSYSMPGQSNLQQFAGGATTVQQLLDILSGKTAAPAK